MAAAGRAFGPDPAAHGITRRSQQLRALAQEVYYYSYIQKSVKRCRWGKRNTLPDHITIEEHGTTRTAQEEEEESPVRSVTKQLIKQCKSYEWPTQLSKERIRTIFCDLQVLHQDILKMLCTELKPTLCRR